MVRCNHVKIIVAMLLALTLGATGCGLSRPAPKPDFGPAGKPAEAKPNPPLLSRFATAPVELYDLEAGAGAVFEGLNKGDWQQAENNARKMYDLWQQAKQKIGDMKGVADGDKALDKLQAAVAAKKVTASYENLNKFMSTAADIGKNYKLSPITDIIGLGNAVRAVAFYVEDKDWSKAAAKAQALENAWGQFKPSLEQPGILGEVTKSHAYITQIKDAVNGENKDTAQEQITNLNESMGRIREYYKGKL